MWVGKFLKLFIWIKGSYTVKTANLISKSVSIIRIPNIFHLTYLLPNHKVVSFSFSWMTMNHRPESCSMSLKNIAKLGDVSQKRKTETEFKVFYMPRGMDEMIEFTYTIIFIWIVSTVLVTIAFLWRLNTCVIIGTSEFRWRALNWNRGEKS